MLDGDFETLVLATGNPHKVQELSVLLAPLELSLLSLADFPEACPVTEDGSTLAENARLKASGYARQIHQWVLSDDTGLEVDALDGAPGVHSARYAGEGATMPENCARLLADLEQVPESQRTARFVCHLILANPEGTIVTEATGVCPGRIRHESAGGGGFGYDALFEVDECCETLAELSPKTVALVGHRGRAVRKLLEQFSDS